MTRQTLLALEALERAATPGPWYVRHFDDERSTVAIAISTNPDNREDEAFGSDKWSGADVVAACLIQAPPYVVPADSKWHENATLIAAVRNALPELLRLARLGLPE